MLRMAIGVMNNKLQRRIIPVPGREVAKWSRRGLMERNDMEASFLRGLSSAEDESGPIHP